MAEIYFKKEFRQKELLKNVKHSLYSVHSVI